MATATTHRRRFAQPERPRGEPPVQQIASFVEFFIWLLVLKTFFLPLFIIPTGSMAETLYGAHGMHTCPNCGWEYAVGFDRAPGRDDADPTDVRCPNCRWVEPYAAIRNRLRAAPGDRIVVHGWPYELGGAFGPRTWDVVVFRNPAIPDENYIKRLVGLPGQKIEIINGDLFIDDEIARKPHRVQDTMWFNFYDHDYAPRRPSPPPPDRFKQTPFVGYRYRPHWQIVEGAAWEALETRYPRFAGKPGQSGAIRLLTHDDTPMPVCEIVDEYGYNWRPRHPGNPYYAVSDLRLSTDVRIASGDGYVELSLTRRRAQYYGRLYASGRVTLEVDDPARGRQTLAEGRAALPIGTVNFALSVVDYSATAEIDGSPVLEWKDEITRGRAIELGRAEQQNREAVALAQRVLIAASNIDVTFGHLRLQRDIYYTHYALNEDRQQAMLRAVQEQPFQLGEGEYFVLGDNSPASSDGRFWDKAAPFLQNTGYRLGTVPEDQLIGRAFFVYWPGFLPMWEGGPLFHIGKFPVGPNILPNFGQIRWIH